MAILPPYTSVQSDSDIGLTFSDFHYSATLAATTDTILTIPDFFHRYKAIIKVSSLGTVTVFFAVNGVAAAPAGAGFAATTSEIINEYDTFIREVKSGDALHFFSTGANAHVTVGLYKVPGGGNG